MGDHAAVAAQTMDEALVHAIIDDPDEAPISDALRETLKVLKRLTKAPDEFGADDIAPALAAGVRPEAIEEALRVCFVFSVILRFVDSFGFPSRTAAERTSLGKNLMRLGYKLAAVPGRSRPGSKRPAARR